MSYDIFILSLSTISIGFIHTILGPDHYLPFIAIAKAKQWTHKKTALITFICGLGHVLSSFIIALLGILLGLSLEKLDLIEGYRGSIAAWIIITFGFIYFIWGITYIVRNKQHTHYHIHNTTFHVHQHNHHDSHIHIHHGEKSITPWVLFIIFIFGPCEPLIPMVIYPVSQNHFGQAVFVSLLFSLTTITTMLTVVIISSYGLSLLSFNRFEKYSHAISGLIIFLCGIGIQFLGL
ncbi:MAG: sulfite exporter TauE/SafE family protein [Spirochaetota bacterium]